MRTFLWKAANYTLPVSQQVRLLLGWRYIPRLAYPLSTCFGRPIPLCPWGYYALLVV